MYKRLQCMGIVFCFSQDGRHFRAKTYYMNNIYNTVISPALRSTLYPCSTVCHIQHINFLDPVVSIFFSG